MTTAVRVFIVDDHRIFAESLAISLGLFPDLDCVGVAHSVAEGRERLQPGGVDVVLLDLDLPDSEGLELIAQLGPTTVRIIVLTAHPRPRLAQRALAAGAHGFLGKDVSLHEIGEAIRRTMSGEQVLGLDPSQGLRLTPREDEVLQALQSGKDANQIASLLSISIYTARDHIRSLMAKLGAHSQLEAVARARSLGLLPLGPGR